MCTFTLLLIFLTQFDFCSWILTLLQATLCIFVRHNFQIFLLAIILYKTNIHSTPSRCQAVLLALDIKRRIKYCFCFQEVYNLGCHICNKDECCKCYDKYMNRVRDQKREVSELCVRGLWNILWIKWCFSWSSVMDVCPRGLGKRSSGEIFVSKVNVNRNNSI